jgi:hypothetical protein
MWVSCRSFFFPLLLHSIEGAGRWVLNCPHRGTTVLSWGLCEQGGSSACPLSALDPRSPTPVQYRFLILTPWLSDSFLSSAVAQRMRLNAD